MGIRINTLIGYGMTVDSNGFSGLIDEKKYYDSNVMEKNFDDYPEYVKSLITDGSTMYDYLREMELKMIESDKDIDLQNICVYDVFKVIPTKDGRSIIVFIPVNTVGKWHRYGDEIDHYNYYANNDEPEDSIEYLDNGIFPFSGVFMDKRTGEEIPRMVKDEETGEIKETLHTIHMLQRAVENCESKDDSIGIISELDDLVREVGFNDYSEFSENSVPMVPVEIKNLVKYLDMFTDAFNVNDLRPLIATYWD